MSEHDPLCLKAHTREGRCTCTYVASVRADERERIAQAMADSESAAAESWRLTGESYYEGRRDAYDLAEQIARNGGSDA